LKRLDGNGDETSDSGKYSYGGKELDEGTELYYFNARYYDATTGRFINVDPVQDGSNWYVYCGNNPLCFIDPTGLFHTGVILSGQFCLGGNRISGSIEIRMASDRNGNNTMAIQATTTDGKPIPVENPGSSGPPVIHFSGEADFGVAYILGNADNVQQLENKGKTSGGSLGFIIGGQFELSHPVDENGNITKNQNGKDIYELQVAIPVLFPGIMLGFEYHIDNETNTITFTYIINDNSKNKKDNNESRKIDENDN
jgi:RHS repeat-associated protein